MISVFSEYKTKGKVEVYYYDFNLTAEEIAEKLHISISEVEDIIHELEEEKKN